MSNTHIASVQFENISGTKAANLNRSQCLTTEAGFKGCESRAFQTNAALVAVRLEVTSIEISCGTSQSMFPGGPNCNELIEIARENGAAVLAGLFETDGEGNIYNSYVCVSNNGFVAKFRIVHPFINQHVSPGNEYVVFELFGWRCGILIWYADNVIENVRATALLYAEIIFMPHVTLVLLLLLIQEVGFEPNILGAVPDRPYSE